MDGYYYTQPASEDEKQQAEANDWERLMNISRRWRFRSDRSETFGGRARRTHVVADEIICFQVA